MTLHDDDMPVETYAYQRPALDDEISSFSTYLDKCLQHRSSVAQQRNKILDLLDQYYDYATDRANTLRKRHDLEVQARSGYDDDGMDMDLTPNPDLKESLERWEEEAQTWDLLRRLQALKYNDPKKNAHAKGSTLR